MNWYALWVRSQYERPVAAELLLRGMESYLPLLPVTRHWSDRDVYTDTPAFPGYVFVRFDQLDRLRVLTVTGAVALLGLNGPEVIPDDQIDAVRIMMSAPDIRISMRPAKGAAVRITGGPLAGTYGTVDVFRRRCRVCVTIPLMGQSVSAEVDLADVEVIEDRRAGQAA